jgi:hypothetical protein
MNWLADLLDKFLHSCLFTWEDDLDDDMSDVP